MSTEGQAAAQVAIQEVLRHYDAWIGDHVGEPYVSLGERQQAGRKYRYRDLAERNAIEEWLCYEWLVAHGVPALTLATVNDGQPYPCVPRPEVLSGGVHDP